MVHELALQDTSCFGEVDHNVLDYVAAVDPKVTDEHSRVAGPFGNVLGALFITDENLAGRQIGDLESPLLVRLDLPAFGPFALFVQALDREWHTGQRLAVGSEHFAGNRHRTVGGRRSGWLDGRGDSHIRQSLFQFLQALTGDFRTAEVDGSEVGHSVEVFQPRVGDLTPS